MRNCTLFTQGLASGTSWLILKSFITTAKLPIFYIAFILAVLSIALVLHRESAAPMDEFSHLANRFKSKLRLNDPRSGQGSAAPGPGYLGQPVMGAQPQTPLIPQPSGNPNVPIPQRPPQVPPRPNLSNRPSIISDARTPQSPGEPSAGAIYAPGSYPTPELPLYPLQKSLILQPPTLQDYTSSTIQAALKELGPSTTLYLPPQTTWHLDAPLVMEAFQEIATLGYPEAEDNMAILEAGAECRPHLIHAFDKSGIRIRNLVIEGNKEKHGWDKDGGVMIQLGGTLAHNQVLDRCVIRNPRHWSCVQAFEGAHNVRITNNVIGPAGVGWDIDQMRWADGISYAASDGLIAGNIITDTTDGAIVLFNAPGTLVTSNTIVTKTRLGLGAINMVDFIAHEGNYTFTRVTHNTIVTAGTMLKIGIGQGCSVWNQPGQRQVIYGAIVSHNLITRDLKPLSRSKRIDDGPPSSPPATRLGEGTIGYGFPVGADVTNWTCVENVSDDIVVYEGDISSTLPGFLNASPAPFVHDAYGNADGDEADEKTISLQPEFVQGKIWGILAVKPGVSRVLSFDGGGLKIRRGHSVRLHGVEMHFRQEDLELCICKLESELENKSLWEAGISQNIDAHRPELEHAMIFFTTSGKLLMVDESDIQSVFFDLTPHIPAHIISSPSSKRPMTPKLVLSSEAPYLTVSSAQGNLLYGSSYQFPRFTEFPVGKYAALPTPHSGGAFVWTLSPQRQFLVLHTHVELPAWIHWPLPEGVAQVVCSFGDGKTDDVYDLKAKLVLQGDGHLLIVDGEGRAAWGSGTHGDRGAFTMHFGLGHPSDPYVELRNAEGHRLWCT